MRLIDADNAISVMRSIGDREYRRKEGTISDAIKMLGSDAYTPTVDAEPIRHGKWIDCGDFEQCSECKGTQLKMINTMYGEAIWMKTDYCPNCGAKMDGKDAENGN